MRLGCCERSPDFGRRRVKHHAYWFVMCPGAGTANGAGIGSIGPPGSYNDILEKRNGEWRFIERNIALNEKYVSN